jgi:hypothetical protein
MCDFLEDGLGADDCELVVDTLFALMALGMGLIDS